jgi:hypothetical protein
MKNFLLTLIALVLLSGCSKNENQMELTGTIKGLKKGVVLLERIGDSSLITVDSIAIDGDPNFSFSTEVLNPEMFYLYLRLKNGDLLDERIPFFGEASEINIQTSLENFGNDQVITGSVNQNKAAEYNKIMRRYVDKNLELIKEELEAKIAQNDSLVASLQNQRQRLISSKYLAVVNFARNNGAYEIAPYLMLTDASEVNVTYLDTVYGNLSPKIKDSKYGKNLKSLIDKRNNSL